MTADIIDFGEAKQQRLHQAKLRDLFNEAVNRFNTTGRHTTIEGIFIVVKTYDADGYPTFSFTRDGIPLEELEELLKKLAPVE